MAALQEYLKFPIYAYLRARGVCFTAQFAALNSISLFLPGQRKFLKEFKPEVIETLENSLKELLLADAQRIADGIYPIQVLEPESAVEHVLRIPFLLADGLSLYYRRIRGRTTVFDKKAKSILADLPRYYRRNFHFQTGGYLSSTSAKLYEHQVELLFQGSADAMRRLTIIALKKKFPDTDGRGLHFLEVAAGTGRSTRFVSLAFPKAKITILDLSEAYLKEAAKKLSNLNNINYVQGDAGALPFKNEMFDAVYSVFLFHELPYDVRLDVVKEGRRVLKQNGAYVLVDSLQLDDHPILNPLLKNFPETYHEPFYRNYIEHPMEDVLKKAGMQKVKTDIGFFSKLCSASIKKS